MVRFVKQLGNIIELSYDFNDCKKANSITEGNTIV